MRMLAVVVGFAIVGAVVPVGVGAQSLGFLSQWGSYGAGNGQFNTPVGITTDQTGKVYVTDYGNARVEVFSGDGAYLTQWSTLENGFSTPTGVAVSSSGDVYVSEHTMNRIQVFTSGGAFLRLWGTGGIGPGQFNGAYGVALGPDGTVYVADTYNSRVQAFTAMGDFLTMWATVGGPIAIATDAAGRVFVAEGPVKVYSSTGSPLATYAMPPGCYARGVTVSPNRIFVADAAGNRVFEFTSSGVYIRQTGGRGSGPGQFNDPTALCVDGDGHVLVTDSFNHRVQKLGDVVVPTLGLTWGHLKALYR